MAAIQIQEYRGMTAAQGKEALLKLRKEQMNLRFQKATGQLENPNRLREIKLEIARLKTAAVELAAKEKGQN
ncbi:MAG: 50S ribosomal protein L29 [Alphaproteobacteria bacterium]|nr:50S ribosomal protein L29 [Alphaproteobacteria bacterium]MDD9919515.1 50S ribosomal protein L29 [Alphaproteobacteria bacterium]